MGVAVSSSHVVSATPSSSGGGLLTLFVCSSVRSLSRETVLHKLLQRESFPWGAVLHKLPQCGSLPQGAVLQEQAAPAWVLHRVTSPANKPAPAWASLSPRAHRTWQEPAAIQASYGVTASSPHTSGSAWGLPWAAGGDLFHRGHLLYCGPPWTAGGQPASPWSSSQATGEKSLLQHLKHLLLLLH